MVQPDIFFISRERLNIIGEKNIQGAPDLVIEILSESTAYRDLVKKKKIYASFGVKEYWIVDPEEKTVEIYLLEGNAFTLSKRFDENDVLSSPLLTGLEINLRQSSPLKFIQLLNHHPCPSLPRRGALR